MPTPSTPPAQDLGKGLGIIDTQSFAQRYPALAHGVASEVARESGQDPNDPRTVVTAMHSRTYQQKLDQMSKNKDDRFLKRLIGTVPTMPDRNAPAEQQQEQLYAGQEQSMVNQIRARGVLGSRAVEAQNRLDELSDFDRESFTQQRLDELAPTKDIDDRVLQLRMQAFTAKAMLRNELRALPPNLRDDAISSRMQVFANTIDRLQDIREARISSAKSKIGQEISAHNEEVRTAKSKVSALKSIMDSIEQTGKDSEALASIRMDYLKELKKVNKAGKAGIPDEVETLMNSILNAYVKSTGEAPSKTQIDEAERQAKETIKRRSANLKNIPGGASALAGIRIISQPEPIGLGTGQTYGGVASKAQTDPESLNAEDVRFLKSIKDYQGE